MKKTIIGLFAGFALLAFAAAAQAEILTIAADVPLSYSFSDSARSADSISGSKISLNFIAFPVGIGVETYTISSTAATVVSAVDVQMYDLFYTLPIPIVSLVAGVGFGTGTVAGSDDGALTQYWFSAGIPIFPLFDIHLGYHSVTGTSAAGVDMGGTMTSLGIKFGF